MILFYRVFTRLLYPFLFILIFFRVFFKKEDSKRYKEKILISHFNIKRKYNKKLIWFHAASIGELKSIIPIVQRLNINSREFLITTTTLSSSKIADIEFKKFDNVYHRFFPFDIDFLIRNFLELWKPDYIFLVDSEVWPNLILNAKKLKIPLAIINARITSKSFKKWIKFPKIAAKIFGSFDLCLASNKETEIFLKKLNVKNVKYYGNIKFINDLDKKNLVNQNEEVLINRYFWIAASTHPGEEELCLKTHLLLKKKYDNILTIIAPRHIDRCRNIINLCEKYNINAQILTSNELIESKNEVVILNSFGVLQSYFKYAKSVFMGKSTLKKLEEVGGQNPLEAVKLKCKIYHGPYVYNFKDIYEILKKNNVSTMINNHEDLNEYLTKDFESSHKKNENISKIIAELENKILNSTLKDINNFIFDEN